MKNKQIISVLLCIALALSLFCSCGKKEKAEKYTDLSWYIIFRGLIQTGVITLYQRPLPGKPSVTSALLHQPAIPMRSWIQ